MCFKDCFRNTHATGSVTPGHQLACLFGEKLMYSIPEPYTRVRHLVVDERMWEH